MLVPIILLSAFPLKYLRSGGCVSSLGHFSIILIVVLRWLDHESQSDMLVELYQLRNVIKAF